MSAVYLDIETCPADPSAWEPKEPISAPATYKDPDKIAAYVAEKRTEQHQRTGFDVHAGVAIESGERAGLERLLRYLARPPVAEHRLRELPDGYLLPRGSPRSPRARPH